MKQKMPRTSFSTGLSGNAKETELRIRNIFQWKKKRPPVMVFLAVLLLVTMCCGLVGFIPANGAAAKEMTLNLIEDRQIVPESHLELLDDETRRMVKGYNEATQALQSYYTEYATRIAEYYSGETGYAAYMKHAWGGHRALYYYFVQRVSKLALYSDAYARMRNDPYVDIFLTWETGGSGILWSVLIHSDAVVSSEVAVAVQEYFTLIDNLTVRLST